jgi:ERO1-like protein beta
LAEGDYVDLTLVPEHYTGYAGQKAHRVWRSIYEENCFGLSDFGVISGKSPVGITLPETMNEHLDDADEQCLEKRVYYKIISGRQNSYSDRIEYASMYHIQVFMLPYPHTYAMII